MNPAALWTGRLKSVAWVGTWVYVIVLGGSPAGEISAWTQAINGVASFALAIAWVRGLRRGADRVDLALVLLVLAFAVASLFSEFPRVAFDALVRVIALAAGFSILRRAASVRAARRAAEGALGWLALSVGLLFSLIWVGALINWLNAGHWSVLPPLSLQIPTLFFGHKHDVAFLVVLLVPATLSPAFRDRRWVAGAGLALATIVVLIDASRNVWLAVAVATLGVTVVRGWRLRADFRPPWLLAGAAILAAALASTFLMPSLVSRISNMWTAGARVELWSSAIGLWFQHPLTGTGPGTFPFAYLQTDYFATSNFDPRHPDSAVVQLAVEAGVLGLLAASGVLAAVASQARTGLLDNARALWACLAFLVGCLAANPSDFVFLMVPAMFWSALLVPMRQSLEAPRETVGHHGAAVIGAAVRVSGLGALGVALVLGSSASILYEVARGHHATGDRASAIAMVRAATVLDPTQALYWRELGSLELENGSAQQAATHYATALALIPVDPVALRGYALAESRLGDPDAQRWAIRATELKPLQSLNWVALALVANEPAIASSALSRAIALNPILAASDWNGTALGRFDRETALRNASMESARSPSPAETTGPLLTNLMTPTGNPIAAARVIGPRFLGAKDALVAAWTCDYGAAAALIRRAETTEREEGFFWLARSLVTHGADGETEAAGALARLYESVPGGPIPIRDSMLSEGNSDVWRYRRLPIAPVDEGLGVPSRVSGLRGLTTDPSSALGLETWPPGCGR